MKSDQTDQEAFEAMLRRVAEAIAPELERGGVCVEVDSIVSAMAAGNLKDLNKTTLTDTKEQFVAIESALRTLGRARDKLESVGINADRISEIEAHYQLMLGLSKAKTGREKLTTKGGVNWPAREVGKMIARAFFLNGVGITFGIMPDGTGPSTAFGRCVEAALKELNIDADWRRAAESGRDVAKKLAAEIELAHREGTYR